MAKIHEIEKCMRCGGLVYPLIPSNRKDINKLRADIERFIENPTKGEDVCLSVFTPFGMAYDVADITYYLCANCCMDIVAHIMRLAVAEDREILFRNFDDLRKELKT